MSEQKNTTTKTIKIPGPAHPITIECNLKRVVISIGGTILADSRDALILREAGYSAVQYIPRREAAIRNHLALYPDRVDAIEERPDG